MATYSELAPLLETTVGELSNFASQNLKDVNGKPFPPGVKTALTDEQVDLLIVEFPKYKADMSQAEARQLPGSSSSIQETKTEIPTTNPDSQCNPHSFLDQARLNLNRAIEAKDLQAMEILQNEIKEIQEGSTQIGFLKAVLGADAEVKGFLSAKNAIARSNQSRSGESLRKQAEMLVGGTDFLMPWESPAPLDSIAQDTLDQLKKLSES